MRLKFQSQLPGSVDRLSSTSPYLLINYYNTNQYLLKRRLSTNDCFTAPNKLYVLQQSSIASAFTMYCPIHRHANQSHKGVDSRSALSCVRSSSEFLNAPVRAIKSSCLRISGYPTLHHIAAHWTWLPGILELYRRCHVGDLAAVATVWLYHHRSYILLIGARLAWDPRVLTNDCHVGVVGNCGEQWPLAGHLAAVATASLQYRWV